MVLFGKMTPCRNLSTLRAACLSVLIALGSAWSAPEGAESGASADRKPVPLLKAPATDAASGASPASPASAARPAPTVKRANWMGAASEALGEHAPLAMFSLGSLAVGGVFYGINASMHRSNVSYTAADRSQLTSAVGVAGLTAVLAVGSYFYYAHKSGGAGRPRDWEAEATGGISPDGGIGMGALLKIPLSSLSL